MKLFELGIEGWVVAGATSLLRLLHVCSRFNMPSNTHFCYHFECFEPHTSHLV